MLDCEQLVACETAVSENFVYENYSCFVVGIVTNT